MNRIEWFGAIAASDWVDNLHHKLPIPRGCREVLACEVNRLTGRARDAAERLLKARPRVRKIIVWGNTPPPTNYDHENKQ